MVKQEFQEAFREITLLGFGIVFIAHAKEKTSQYTDEDGNALSVMSPDIPNSCYTIVNGICDLIAYIGLEFDTKTGHSERYLYTRQTPTIFAGSRWARLAPKIKFGYDELVNAIGDAIDESVSLDGAQVTDKTEQISITRRPFEEVMEEARQFWVSFIDKATTDEDKDRQVQLMNDVIKRVFGKVIKLSTVMPSQIDLLELVVQEFNNL